MESSRVPGVGGTEPEAADEGRGAARRPGTVQAVTRASRLLKVLAAAPAEGARLRDVAAAAELDRGTTHRLLLTLCDEGFVEQDRVAKTYRLGLDFFALASAASNRYDVQEVARQSLQRLAEATGDTAFFCLRGGNDYVCVDVKTGRYPIKTLPYDIGARVPLGVGATGVAILADLSAAEVQDILDANAPRFHRFTEGEARAAVEAALADCRRLGYAVYRHRQAPGQEPGQGQGITSLARSICDRRGRPVTALALSAISERMDEARIRELAEVLREAAAEIYAAMMRRPEALRHRSRWEESGDQNFVS